ncbi:ATM1-type heavy metal exporter [BD1-7 clade bacterium]|uniref:ATM1-type heavy metal exporter n=1 Tax=BD1-7 clade bacterium TaxID=2029982 RepID=A0A5S9QHV1_9GAMM|nr:ATM1-type heavy metal exporter [BD1-7 clade bacterium]CAA0117225.1 ATM1-type heavy metal exporter [BD1-7 clade bacterium]
MRHGVMTDIPESVGINWQPVKMLIPYFMQYRNRILLAMSCLILAKVAAVNLPFFLKHIVDALDTPTKQAVAAPLGLVGLYGLVRFLNVVFNELRDTLFGRVTERSIRQIGLSTFRHLHNLDLDYHMNRKTGGLSRDIERGTTGINFLMRFMVFNIVPTLIEVLLIAGLLYINYGWLFAAMTLISVVIYVAFTVKATEWRTSFIREANQADSASNGRAIDSLLNYETVKYFTNEDYEAKRYDKELAGWEVAKRKNRLSLFALNAGQALIIASAMTSMLALAAAHTADGAMTIGDFVLVNAFMMQIFIPLNFLGFVYREIKGSLINIEKMFKLLDQKPTITDAANADDVTDLSGNIRFEQVDFSYHQDRQILDGVNLDIEAGTKVAVVGESGSGKSTLVKLLFRFYDPSQGRITIDGHDIRTLKQHSLRSAIGIVPQETVLFNDTILENIRYGNPEASDEDVFRAIDHAHLGEFIETLPKGVETVVGERGLKLSGGEKQRVAIARTILKNPSILVFDEATSSLDSHAEQRIVEALNDIGTGRTTLVIAHRLSTIVDADCIVVMHHGRVIEQGTHKELVNKGNAYAKLWELQQQEEQAA